MARKIDRRTLYTIKEIKRAFLALTKEDVYAKISVAAVCRQAEITRSTFYLHFNTLDDLLNQVLDDAIEVADQELKENSQLNDVSWLATCQKIGSTPKYRKLLMDPDLSEYIINRIIRYEEPTAIPLIMQKAGVSQKDAKTLFVYGIHGSFAISKSHGFQKDEQWVHDVCLLNKFLMAGYKGLK